MLQQLDEGRLQELAPVFYPESIAVVGASSRADSIGSLWVQGLISSGFRGRVYPVHPQGGQVDGLAVCASLGEVPGPVDLVIVCVPRGSVLDIMDDCAAKGIKAVYFFTAGFSESGEVGWDVVEREMVRRARDGGFRIIGPNCFGVYSPEQGIPYGPFGVMAGLGSVGFLSQSSGHMGKLLEYALVHSLGISKGISLGNGSDLGVADFLEYLALDPRTLVIGAYLEGPRDSRRLFEVTRLASARKPVVVWKGGRSQSGARSAFSHTGALAASSLVWSGALKQAGAIEVSGFDEMADTLLLFEKVGRLEGSNVGVVCGITDGGGGEAVLTCDAFADLGMDVPVLDTVTNAEVLSLVGQVGSVLGNPVDMSQRQRDPEALRRAMELVAGVPAIDILVVFQNAGVIFDEFAEETLDALNDTIVDFSRQHAKPVLAVLQPGTAESRRMKVQRRLSEGGVPVFPSVERLAKAVRNVSRYSGPEHV